MLSVQIQYKHSTFFRCIHVLAVSSNKGNGNRKEINLLGF
jgi:hypothetical protein